MYRGPPTLFTGNFELFDLKNIPRAELVMYAAKKQQVVVTPPFKAQLEEKLYAFDAEVESNTIEVHVSRLRKKLGNGVIETERGLGYRLGAT